MAGQRRLRLEARPVPLNQLDERQRNGFHQVLAFLEAAVSEVPQQVSTNVAVNGLPTGPFLTQARSSRTVLVSGGRGTGKTTLLTTLIRALVQPEELRKEVVYGQVSELSKRLVWLETLDMEALDPSANLLGAVLARLENTMGAMSVEPLADETLSLVHPKSALPDIRLELARLQTSVALSFAGNLKDRGASLDQDTYAIEARRTERERLSINRRFCQVLQNLSAQLDRKPEYQSPLFVLPVDDMDLNPAISVQLLELLRAVQSPHLIVVMAADLALLTTIMRLKYRGDMLRLSCNVPLDTPVRDQVDELADNALTKHLPVAQRVVLDLVEPAWALRYRPEPDLPSLAAKLGHLRFDASTLSLMGRTSEAITLPGLEVRFADDEETIARVSGYSWSYVLRAPIRQISDLYLSLEEENVDPLALLRRRAKDRIRDLSQGFEGMRQEIFIDHWPGGWRVIMGSRHLGPRRSRAYIGCVDIMGNEGLRDGHPPANPPVLRDASWPGLTFSTYWGYERTVMWLAESERLWVGKPDAQFGSWIAVMTTILQEALDSKPSLLVPHQKFRSTWPTLRKQLIDLQNKHSVPIVRIWRERVMGLRESDKGMAGSAAKTALNLPPIEP
ncbi:AAA family ATPase [Nonomuraea sp. NPDC050404]|uniref:AAA family ATPase n=1 Tax=Nonomuraea sp. NPDC050404 TaxID=3155783 RepID=UPI0033DE3609